MYGRTPDLRPPVKAVSGHDVRVAQHYHAVRAADMRSSLAAVLSAAAGNLSSRPDGQRRCAAVLVVSAKWIDASASALTAMMDKGDIGRRP
jgi:hypothetical protein